MQAEADADVASPAPSVASTTRSAESSQPSGLHDDILQLSLDGSQNDIPTDVQVVNHSIEQLVLTCHGMQYTTSMHLGENARHA